MITYTKYPKHTYPESWPIVEFKDAISCKADANKSYTDRSARTTVVSISTAGRVCVHKPLQQ